VNLEVREPLKLEYRGSLSIELRPCRIWIATT